VASILTPYKSSDGNNPYTEAQLKALWKDLEPTAREPGKYSAAERVLLQRTFLAYIQEGYTATRAVSRLQALSMKEPEKWPYADYATFMVWKAYDKDFSEAYEVAYSMGTDALEDKGVEMAYGGNASMLQFLLRMRSPQRYVPPTSGAGLGAPGNPVNHVHRVELVAAKARPLEIEDLSRGPGSEFTEAEVVEDAEFSEDGDDE
jgi:hypothetical protein